METRDGFKLWLIQTATVVHESLIEVHTDILVPTLIETLRERAWVEVTLGKPDLMGVGLDESAMVKFTII